MFTFTLANENAYETDKIKTKSIETFHRKVTNDESNTFQRLLNNVCECASYNFISYTFFFLSVFRFFFEMSFPCKNKMGQSAYRIKTSEKNKNQLK